MLTGIAVLVTLLFLISVPGLLFIFGLGGFLAVALFPFLFESFCASNPASWYSLPCGFSGYLSSLFLFAVIAVIGVAKDV